MKEFDILTIGDLNVDIILNKIESAPIVGKEILCEEMETTIGGSATNFAYNASSLGSKVTFLGMLGNDTNGQWHSAMMKRGQWLLIREQWLICRCKMFLITIWQ